MPNRFQALPGSPYMMNTHPTAESTQTGATASAAHTFFGRNRETAAKSTEKGQTAGTRNGRGRSGSVYRSTSTPVLTSTKAKSVPMFVRSYVSAASPTSAHAATNTPVMIVVVHGTLVF